ncbi:Ubiquitin carboxyl-terminal hydrolase 28, partial [Halocaridina rubra]
MPPSITLGSEPPKPASGPGDHPPQQEPPANKDIPTIDLSKDETDDIQKAIILSLRDQQVPATLTGISAEDREVSRALEASLKESTPQATIDLINPQDRKRQSGVPVGLKNIGNSCWFNVIIQPLFHIPVFRELILSFSQNLDPDEQMEETQKASRQLVPALRKLFALMIGSNRKYIDPTFAVHIFQGQEMRKNAQQDVCEFTHKLLERLEEEYHQLLRRQGVEKESECHVSKDADFENPIMRLFYGHTKKENCEEDDGPKQETFGQYPLHIMNYSSIHESILGSMVSTMPDMTGDTVEPVHQETWFKMLPPVLIFSLSRYEYSLEKKRAEKVHNKFEFPEFLYMDRYMEINKKLIKEKHIKVAKLRSELNILMKTLNHYEKYGSGEAKYPISDILKYTLDFAQTGLNSGQSSETNCVPSPSMMEVDGIENCENDIEMTEAPDVKKELPQKECSEEDGNDTDAPPVEEISCKAEVKEDLQEPLEIKEESVEAKETVIARTPEENEGGTINCIEEGNPRTPEEEPQQTSSPSKRMRILPPAPRNVTTSELTILQSCLSRWLQDINAQVAELRRYIKDLEGQLNQMYDDPVLQRIPYRLHSVVVHEGQASGGHYWVYIFDSTRKTWMKFNDIQVVESNWEELLQDSVGGQNNASAYCLLYIDESRYSMIFPQVPETTESLMGGLNLDLQ